MSPRACFALLFPDNESHGRSRRGGRGGEGLTMSADGKKRGDDQCCFLAHCTPYQRQRRTRHTHHASTGPVGRDGTARQRKAGKERARRTADYTHVGRRICLCRCSLKSNPCVLSFWCARVDWGRDERLCGSLWAQRATERTASTSVLPARRRGRGEGRGELGAGLCTVVTTVT
jgi:hypothetical protein